MPFPIGSGQGALDVPGSVSLRDGGSAALIALAIVGLELDLEIPALKPECGWIAGKHSHTIMKHTMSRIPFGVRR